MKIHILPVFILVLGVAPVAQGEPTTAAAQTNATTASAKATGVKTDDKLARTGVAKPDAGKDAPVAFIKGDDEAVGGGAVGAWIYALFGAAALGFGWLLFRLSRRT